MKNYLKKLQKKCKVDDKLIDIIQDLIDKLVNFGYISSFDETKITKKLFNNIDTIITGDLTGLDYKSGYYDAMKKELYIKDINNFESVYLRILYVLSTTELDSKKFSVGYSTTSLASRSYKIAHKNFGFNRAVMSNLVCRLLYTSPTTLSIVPTYRTYDNDFLGNRINSDNDIYFLEGKLLKQMCFCCNISEEELYSNLFSTSPIKYLNKVLEKAGFEDNDELLKLFDTASRMYSNYNKLCFLNRKLNENYIEIRKNALNDDISELTNKRDTIKLAIKTAIQKLEYKELKIDEEDFDEKIEASLSEKINFLEENILTSIYKIQNILVKILLQNEVKYDPLEYAIKLKEISKMLIVESDILKDAIYSTITSKLLSTYESTASNLIAKIKYSLVNEIISSEKYIKIYRQLSFKKLTEVKLKENTSLVALTVDNTFLNLVEISNLDKKSKDLEKNTKVIHLDNLRYLLTNPSMTTDTYIVEEIFTAIKAKSKKYSNIQIENVFWSSVYEPSLLFIMMDDEFDVLKMTINDGEIKLTKVPLSENYNVFNINGDNLPSVYNKKKTSIFQKIVALFTFI